MSNLVEKSSAYLGAIRRGRPLVHNITNYVVMNFSANALLSLGASPVMAHAVEEVEEMTGLAGALVINIGTLSRPWIEAMLRAGRVARERRIPVVLDPVGAGATRYRTDTAQLLVREVGPAVIRGNASEVLNVARQASVTKGVDSSSSVDEALDAAERLARSTGAVVAVTGAEDYVTDGRRHVRIANGHPLMGRVTGTGCVATAICGAFLAVADDPFAGTGAALAVFGMAGELAAENASRPGSYRVALIDALDAVNDEDIRSRARLTEGQVGS